MTRALLLLASVAVLAAGHGFVTYPPSRNSVEGRTCPHCAQGAGVCGNGANSQWHSGTEPALVNGPFTTAPFEVTLGGILEVVIDMRVGHLGSFIVDFCRPTGDLLTEECFSERLLRDPTDQRNSAYLPEAPQQAFFVENQCIRKLHRVRYLVPENLGTCEHCVFRWFWQTGNSCMSSPFLNQATMLPALANWRDEQGCKVTPLTNESCGTDCPNAATCLAGEKYRNCIDVRLVSKGGQTTSSTPRPTSTTLTTTTTSTTLTTTTTKTTPTTTITTTKTTPTTTTKTTPTTTTTKTTPTTTTKTTPTTTRASTTLTSSSAPAICREGVTMPNGKFASAKSILDFIAMVESGLELFYSRLE